MRCRAASLLLLFDLAGANGGHRAAVWELTLALLFRK